MPHFATMAFVRRVCSLLVILAFVAGLVLPASHTVMAHETSASAVHHADRADCDHCNNGTAAPVPCAKLSCLGVVLALPAIERIPDAKAAKHAAKLNEDGSGLSLPFDTPPPRSVLIG